MTAYVVLDSTDSTILSEWTNWIHQNSQIIGTLWTLHLHWNIYHLQCVSRDRGETVIHCSLLITPELQKSELVLIKMNLLLSAQTACVRCSNASPRLPKSQFNWNKYWLAYIQALWLSNHENTHKLLKSHTFTMPYRIP